jgi:hypothetical protein
VAFTKAEKYVQLRILNALTKGASQAELTELRQDVLQVLGLDESKAAELTTADARAEHTQPAEDAPVAEDAPAEDATP